MSNKVNYEGNSYSKFRPTYSDRLYSLIYDFHQGKYDKALDVGTGTGQGAIALSNRFKQVYGVDRLQEMINNATPKDNVTYSVGSAEWLDFDDHSLDMITVATAFHWFDHPSFFQQVKRVLKPGGTLAVWGYYLPIIKNHEAATQIIKRIFAMDGPIQTYSDPNIKYIINMYRDIPFPFSTVDYYISPSSEDITGISKPCGSLMEKTMSLADFGNFLKTASSYVNYKKDHHGNIGPDPVDDAIENIADLLQTTDKENTLIDLEWACVLVLARDDA
ncbi:S-adenosyl-L-methionine-dependent methyltransferase [Halteromyces radiatus]|uniref:S-adenosyl-L-methionine-dependent methyltransferase n=1 Tax=Halteromyces radiatus TaxID=101107 RepID=UPI00221F2088|nr:S-adenosyl-L-methionine-dependent methyltransferase [Halteromyces radiatus]KAI8098859.1 S-adenosyl-L-methionine-dependent methyltransferase [Halteromyces radiatus]